MVCKNCSKQIPQGASTCPFCGTAVHSAAPQQPPAQPPLRQPAQQGYGVPRPIQQAVQQPAQQPYSAPQQPFAGAATAFAQQGQAMQAAVAKQSKVGLVIGIVGGVLALLAIVVAVFIFVNKPEKKFYGEWTATLDYTQEVKNAMGSLKDKFDSDFKFTVKMNFVFNRDNTYSISIDESALEGAKNSFRGSLENALFHAFKELYPQVGEYSLKEFKDYYEKLTGKDFDAYVDAAMEGFDIQKMIEESRLEGNFKADKDRFYISAAKDKRVDEEVYALYEMSSDTTMKVTDYVINGVSSKEVFPTPFVMEKVK